MGTRDLGKVAFVFGMLAFQLHILTMTVSQYLLKDGILDRHDHKNNVIQAFLIIAYLLFVLSVLLLLVLSFSNLKGNKCLSVFTAIFLFLAASSVVVGLAVFDAEVYWNDNTSPFSRPFSSYTTTTYSTGAASGYIAAVVLLVNLCV